MNDLLPWLLLFAVTLAWYLDRQAPCPPPSPASSGIVEAPQQLPPHRRPTDSAAVLPLNIITDVTATPDSTAGS